VTTLIKEGKGGEPIGSILENRQVPALHPDHPLDMSLRYVDRWQVVPVVNRANLRELEGVITQRDVLERYRDFGGE
jgi:CBS domain-containing protein